MKTSASASSASSRWSKQEKELFENGLVRVSCFKKVYKESNFTLHTCV